jgi:hypothetical protein
MRRGVLAHTNDRHEQEFVVTLRKTQRPILVEGPDAAILESLARKRRIEPDKRDAQSDSPASGNLRSMNFHRHWPMTSDADQGAVADAAVATLRTVYGWQGEPLQVKLHLDW